MGVESGENENIGVVEESYGVSTVRVSDDVEDGVVVEYDAADFSEWVKGSMVQSRS